ncbi:hypothetical protein [Ruminococcus albus]|uniref:Uncharacterized protein n=1 Tax=Ruminococcus albus TaxID=1264 RepID=A0A1I1JP17_RUMAL|nr:hypothetical protein [Ruminococcus albus]SFC50135.1 hypothetical protein SAMN02910406_01819 [Ruminococcus albus]
MAESIFVVDFKVESEAYQALSELKANPVNDSYTASSAFVVKNENGHIIPKDSFDTADTHIEVLSHSISDVKSEVLWRFH